MTDTELIEIITTAIGASTDPSLWCEVCDRLSARTDALFSLVFEYDPVARSAPILHTPSELYRVEDFLEQFMSGASMDDPRIYQALSLKSVGEYQSEVELLRVENEEALPPNAFRDGYFNLVGAISRGGAKLNDIGPFLDALTLHLRIATRDIPDRLRKDVQVLAPVLGKVIELSRTFRALSQGFGALLEIFDGLDCGAAICRKDGHALLVNQKMMDLAKEGDAISSCQPSILCAITGETAKVAALVRSAGHPNSLPGDLIITLRRRSSRLPIVVKAAPIRSAEIVKGDGLVLLLVLDPADVSRLSATGLMAFGVLSDAELAVCELLVQGWPTEEIAIRRDTSPETTRTQIKSAAAKLACRSRLDLVRLAILTRAPIGAARITQE